MRTVRLGLTLAILLCGVVTISACGGGNNASDGGNSTATKPNTTPVIVTAPEMDDEHCVEEVEEAIGKIEGVGFVECDMPNRTVRVYPKEGVELSAKAIWEGFESCSFDKTKEAKITKLDGPSGVFTSKPDK